jgi:hypothetical protein
VSLFAPWRTERVDLASARPPGDVVAAIEARASRASLPWGWAQGSGVALRGGPRRLVLAVRHGYGDPTRPFAIVRVEPAPGGSRVAGWIGLSLLGRLWCGTFALFGVVVTAAAPFATVLAGAWPMLVAGPLLLLVAVVAPRLSYGDRAALRTLLAEAAR